MKFSIKLYFFILLTALIAGRSFAAVKVGSEAPDFSLTSIADKQVKLSDFKGKVVFLDFWATWCPPCRMTTPVVMRLAEKFKKKDVVFIGISIDEDLSSVISYVEKNKIEHLMLHKGDSRVELDYRIRAVPTFVIIDRSGTVVNISPGFRPDLEAKWEELINELLSKKGSKNKSR